MKQQSIDVRELNMRAVNSDGKAPPPFRIVVDSGSRYLFYIFVFHLGEYAGNKLSLTYFNFEADVRFSKCIHRRMFIEKSPSIREQKSRVDAFQHIL